LKKALVDETDPSIKLRMLKRDKNSDAAFHYRIDICLDDIKEPILCCPNDPDDAKTLSEHLQTTPDADGKVRHEFVFNEGKEGKFPRQFPYGEDFYSVAGTSVQEVFIGSCMTNIGHFRAAAQILEGMEEQIKDGLPTRLWVVPPTKMDGEKLAAEGILGATGFFNSKAMAGMAKGKLDVKLSQGGAREEIAGCSLCMGNQARMDDHVTALSTSTRNFPNRMGKMGMVFLASAELCAVAAALGYIPTAEEYIMIWRECIDQKKAFQYLNFHLMEEFVEKANLVEIDDNNNPTVHAPGSGYARNN